MKIERIGENKIKITISMDDLEERNIDLTSLNYNSPAAQELFWDMMEEAEAQFGFDLSDSQLVIEPVPDSDTGFIIMITKVDDDEESFESIQKYIKNRFKRNDLKAKKRNRKVYSSLLIYSFREFDDLCELCKKISSMYCGDSSVYKLKGIYYLALTRNCFTTGDAKMLEALLGEYGRKVHNPGFFEGYLNEYGETVIDHNSIEVINKYF